MKTIVPKSSWFSRRTCEREAGRVDVDRWENKMGRESEKVSD